MDQQLSDIITQALDDAIKIYESDHRVIYGSESVQLKTYFDLKVRASRSWKKSKQCAFHGCKENSIIRSHSIQKSGPLALIAEKGHLLQPQFTKDGAMQMERVGLRNASVFPGFCKEHEGYLMVLNARNPFSHQGI